MDATAHSKEMTYLAAASDRSPSLYDKKLVRSRLFHQGVDLILLISHGNRRPVIASNVACEVACTGAWYLRWHCARLLAL